MNSAAPTVDTLFEGERFADLLTAALAPDPVPKGLALAISGGGDSMAMLNLAASCARTRKLDLLALTVDHGLRSDSASEAEMVAARCASLGINHKTLHWRGAKPINGMQAAARQARYGLMSQAALSSEIDLLATAHTRDDQIETVMMRSLRGGGRGMAGMSPLTRVSGIRLVRPLLGQTRLELRQTLQANRIRWIEDPSNQNADFERVRARHRVAHLIDTGIDPLRVADLSHAGTALRRWNDRLAVELLTNHVKWNDAGCAVVEGALLTARPAPAANAALGALAMFAGGLSRPPAQPELDNLRSWASAAVDGDARTLGRCVFRRLGGGLHIWRENRDLAEVEIRPGETLAWDNRYRISMSESAPGPAQIGPLGIKGGPELVENGLLSSQIVAAKALETLPALRRNGHIIATPAGNCSLNDKGLTEFRRFCPGIENFPHIADLETVRVLSLW